MIPTSTPSVVIVPFQGGLLSEQYSIFLESVITRQEFSVAVQAFNVHIKPYAGNTRTVIFACLFFFYLFLLTCGCGILYLNEVSYYIIIAVLPAGFFLGMGLLIWAVSGRTSKLRKAAENGVKEINTMFHGRPINWRFVQGGGQHTVFYMEIEILGVQSAFAPYSSPFNSFQQYAIPYGSQPSYSQITYSSTPTFVYSPPKPPQPETNEKTQLLSGSN